MDAQSVALNCCSGCSAWQKGRASSSESITGDTRHSPGSTGAGQAHHKGLAFPIPSCPTQEVYHIPAAWGISSSPTWAFRGRWWEAPDSSCILPRHFSHCSSSAELNSGAVGALQVFSVLPSSLLSPRESARPTGSPTEREGSITGISRRLFKATA